MGSADVASTDTSGLSSGVATVSWGGGVLLGISSPAGSFVSSTGELFLLVDLPLLLNKFLIVPKNNLTLEYFLYHQILTPCLK